MNKNSIYDLRVCFPRWVIICFILSCLGTIFFFLIYLIWLLNKGFYGFEIFRLTLFLVIILAEIWVFLRLLFYSVSATNKGLVTNNLFGPSKSVLWDEIVEVRRPRFGIPADFTYVLSAKNKKVLLIRSMNNYKELIQLIQERAPNIKRFKF